MTSHSVEVPAQSKRVAAALVAVIIVGVQLVQQMVLTLLHLATYISQGSDPMAHPWIFSGLLFSLLTITMPFALGVFLLLWLVSPLAPALRVRAVIGRSLLAVVAGTVVLFVVVSAGAIVSTVNESAGRVFGWAYAAVEAAQYDFGWFVSQALFSAANAAVTLAPLTVLAGVLAWLWLRARSVTGMNPTNLDEV